MAISFQDADKFRLKHAEELLALFEGARGRPARAMARRSMTISRMTLRVRLRRKPVVRPGGKLQRKTAGRLTRKRVIGLMSGLTSGCLKASKRPVGKIILD
jgi:hypothetical protein